MPIKVDRHITILGKSLSPYLLMAIIGITSAFFHMIIIALIFSYDIYVSLGIFCCTLFFAYGYGVINAIIKKEETYVLYRYKTLILIVTTGFLYVIQQPILYYLDVTSIALSSILCFGRIGCYFSGCCHGVPCKKGVTYRETKKTNNYIEEISFIPIQLVEASVHLINVIVGYILLISSVTPGVIFIVHLSSYAIARYIIEFYRGDASRHFYNNVSEAQWFAYGYIIISTLLSFYFFKKYIVVLLLITAFISILLFKKMIQKSSMEMITSKVFHEIKKLSLKSYTSPNSIFKTQIENGFDLAFSKVQTPQKNYMHLSLFVKPQYPRKKIVKKIRKILSYSKCEITYMHSQNIKGVYHFILKNNILKPIQHENT